MVPATLPAKTPKGGVAKGLVEHTGDVLLAAETLFGAEGRTTRLGDSWLRFFKLGRDAGGEFLSLLRTAALAHDLGKANEGFCEAVLRRRQSAQAVRHEHLSALMLAGAELPGRDVDVILSAVLSHHLKADRDSLALSPSASQARLYTGHPDFLRLWDGLDATAPLDFPAVWGGRASWARVEALKARLSAFHDEVERDASRRAMLGAVRAALIAADSAGSSIPYGGEEIDAWINAAFADGLAAGAVDDAVINPRVGQLGASFRWRPFQEKAAMLGPRAALISSCGSGKSLAAWRWASRWADEIGAGRVIWLFPTRGTATEGFKDYVSLAPEATATLLHGTAAYDLAGLYESPEDRERFQADERFYALGAWPKRFFSATADQFFSFLQWRRASVVLMPLLADSVLVVDEVHSYDRAMFSGLLRFLETFDLPVLCMTATMPSARREALEKAGVSVLETPSPDGPRPRYSKVAYVSREEAREEALAAARDGRKVLWVSNKVATCQAVAEGMKREDVETYCYHSRYKMADRSRIHRQFIEAFGFSAGRRGLVGCVTQVAEMALDIDCDLLITEICPTSAILQRMGRCNRRWPEGGRMGRVLVIEPDGSRPYRAGDLEVGRQMVSILAEDESVGEGRLQQVYAACDASTPDGRGAELFWDSGPYAMSGEARFREANDLTVSCVLYRDLPDVKQLVEEKKPWDGYVLPAPNWIVKNFGLERPDYLPAWAGVVPAALYDEFLGLRDAT